MNRKFYFWSIGVLFALISTPYIIYFIVYNCHPFSKDTSSWSNFGQYINGTLSPLIALIGVYFTFVIGMIAERRNRTTIEKQEMEKRPFIYVSYSDFEGKQLINLKNKGIGPLIIKNYSLKNKDDQSVKLSIFECLIGLNGVYNNYSGNQNQLVLNSGEKINLFKLEGKLTDKKYIDLRDRVRERLSHYKIEIIYCDVYGNEMPNYERDLGWFGRNG